MYKVELKPSVEHDIARIPPQVRANLWARVLNLASEPRPQQSLKLEGTRHSWRLRVGDYRILYLISDRERLVTVLAVKHRSQAHR